MTFRFSRDCIAPSLGAVCALLLPLAATAADFQPHRAVYALSRGSGKGGQAVTQVSGSMMIEVDESCDGWSLSQRVRMQVVDSMGEEVESDSRYASYETKDGLTLQFSASDWQNGAAVEETAGTAERDAVDRPGRVDFTKPPGENQELPANAVFPAAFNLKLLQLGEGYHTMTGFDGGNTEGAYTITAFVGKERDSEAKLAEGLVVGSNGKLGGPVRNVRVAYFPIAGQAPEPELEYVMELQPNGVSPAMTLDYQRYQVRATLAEFTELPRPRFGH